MLRQYQHRSEEAARILEDAKSIIETSMGPDHPLPLRALANLATVYAALGRHDDAEAAYRRSLAIAEKKLGTQHPVYGKVLLNYAEFVRKRGDKAGARQLHAQAEAVLKDNRQRNGAGMTIAASSFRQR